jgi:hypothetical protein
MPYRTFHSWTRPIPITKTHNDTDNAKEEAKKKPQRDGEKKPDSEPLPPFFLSLSQIPNVWMAKKSRNASQGRQRERSLSKSRQK